MTYNEHEWAELESYRESLEHYGVPGMKWGVRKEYERKGRGGSSSKIKQRKTFLERKRAERLKRQKEAAAKKEKKKAEQAAKRREENLRSASKLYKHRNDYTQEEINNALKRFEWEKKLRDYSKSEMEAGKKYIDTVFQYANSAINMYNTAARVVNSFDLSEQPWKYIEQPDLKAKKKGDKKDD